MVCSEVTIATNLTTINAHFYLVKQILVTGIWSIFKIFYNYLKITQYIKFNCSFKYQHAACHFLAQVSIGYCTNSGVLSPSVIIVPFLRSQK